MGSQRRVFVLDGSSRRRAELTWELTKSGLAAQPMETLEELLALGPPIGAIFVHMSHPAAVKGLVSFRDRFDQWFPVIVYCQQCDLPEIVDVIRDGASDYLEYPFTGEKACERLDRVIARSDCERAQHDLRVGALKRLEPLSKREREVLMHVSRGDSSKVIARNLSISPRTVELHRANLLNKLDAHSTAEAVRIAMEGGDMTLGITGEA